MGLIAKKPCSFGGKQFFIGDEIPVSFVADTKMQEKLGVVAIVNGGAEVQKAEPGTDKGIVRIAVKGDFGGDNGQITVIPAVPEEIRQVFSIMQMNVADGAGAIAEVESENVLILLHAADSRKKIKIAAKEQADKLFSPEGVLNGSGKGNELVGPDMEGC